MLHRILGISALVAIGSVAFSPTVKAQPFAVPFNGTVEANCTAQTITPGTLTPLGTGTGFNTDVPGEITLTCNAFANYSIDDVVLVSTANPPGISEPSGVTKSAQVRNLTNNSQADWDGVPQQQGTVQVGTNNLEAEMTVTWPQPLPAATYNYEVRFTVANP